MFGNKKKIEEIKSRIRYHIIRKHPAASNINIYRNATDWIVIYELDGKVIAYNQRRILSDYKELSYLERKVLTELGYLIYG